ncbi:hypothetical protein G7077_10620 [Sphingomonas piscis]|uniref:Uncharacterized protein n=1 Tax=Sphingomonas piscis TaxID=2714943 RepID=A0A6G7YRB4_9SPHN|nr:hypothetical protein [Sphingomonas piscis]QIK79285.1 hypothetical protein G7077_10620 [Sphingomonas piscis]
MLALCFASVLLLSACDRREDEASVNAEDGVLDQAVVNAALGVGVPVAVGNLDVAGDDDIAGTQDNAASDQAEEPSE